MDGLLLVGAVSDVWQALALPADLAVVLLAARHRRVMRERAARDGAAAVRDDEDGKWRRNADGSTSVQIRSMETLRAALSRPPTE